MIGIVGRKLGMTQIPTKDGAMTAVTVIEAGPCFVLQAVSYTHLTLPTN